MASSENFSHDEKNNTTRFSKPSVRRLLLGAGLLILGALLLFVLIDQKDRQSSEPTPAAQESVIDPVPIPETQITELEKAIKAAKAKTLSYDYQYGIGTHDDTFVSYPTNPPTNGPHANTWVQDGNYAGQSAPPIGQIVHAQEHGRVVIQYNPRITKPQLGQLVSLYQESPDHVLLVQNPSDMPFEVAATAWGHAIGMQTFTPQSFDAIRAFRATYRDRGPEEVP